MTLSGTTELKEARRLGERLPPAAPGLALAVAIGAVATGIGSAVPLVGAPVFAIVLGLAVRIAFGPGAWATPGISFAGRTVLQAAIVLLGSGLALGTVLRVGLGSLPVMLGTLAAALVGGRLIGRALGIGAPLRTLVTVGTGICGASAIAAVASVVEVESAAVAYAISTIFVFNVAAVLAFPAIGHALGLGQQAFGLWAGTAVNDTSSVVATGYAFGHAAGAHAVVVKLTRTTLIVPVVLGLSLLERRRSGSGRKVAPWRLVPPFLVLFVLAAALNSAGAIGGLSHVLTKVALFLIAVALAGVGLSARPAQIRSTGFRPLVLGAALWLVVALTSLGLQALSGQL
ncbi:MAG TPA: putative sulfate exporter family transporter [Gaiellaceae bacterium]|nr:putative sulfate exporter family transporter [Gaiellaceae bacterium]